MSIVALPGSTAVSDGTHPVKVLVGVPYTVVSPPNGATLPYIGRVIFPLATPPMKPDSTFDLTDLKAIVSTTLASFQQVEVYSGNSEIISVKQGDIKPGAGDVVRQLTALNLREDPGMMDPAGGLTIVYTIRFDTINSSAQFGSIILTYNP